MYEIKVFDQFPSLDIITLPKDLHVTFKAAEDAPDPELPKAALLNCHYRLAEILNASGMAEIIERHLQDWEKIKEDSGISLQEDGGTDIGRLLSVARVVG